MEYKKYMVSGHKDKLTTVPANEMFALCEGKGKRIDVSDDYICGLIDLACRFAQFPKYVAIEDVREKNSDFMSKYNIDNNMVINTIKTLTVDDYAKTDVYGKYERFTAELPLLHVFRKRIALFDEEKQKKVRVSVYIKFNFRHGKMNVISFHKSN